MYIKRSFYHTAISISYVLKTALQLPLHSILNYHHKMAHTSKKRKTTESTAKQPFISLQAYISNAFYGLLIQDDDEIFEISLDNNWSRKVKEK